jgi:hypothetical protein
MLFLFDINKNSIYIKDPFNAITNLEKFIQYILGVITYFLRKNTQIGMGIYRR